MKRFSLALLILGAVVVGPATGLAAAAADSLWSSPIETGEESVETARVSLFKSGTVLTRDLRLQLESLADQREELDDWARVPAHLLDESSGAPKSVRVWRILLPDDRAGFVFEAEIESTFMALIPGPGGELDMQIEATIRSKDKDPLELVENMAFVLYKKLFAKPAA